MEFFCVYCKNRKKFEKYIKVNSIKKKYIIDIKKIVEEEEITNYETEKTYIKILVLKKIQLAIEKNINIYYLPDFDTDFDIEKLLNIKKILGRENNFNILIFWDEFKKSPNLLEDAINNLSRFSNSQIIRDY